MAYSFDDVTVTESAKANGTDVNTVTFILMEGNSYAAGKKITISVSGDALFSSNDENTITVTTNNEGEGSADIIDTTAETIIVKLEMVDDSTVTYSINTMFLKENRKVSSIFMLIAVDDAKADGVDENEITLQALDEDDIPMTSVEITVSLSNDAVFLDGKKSTTITTDEDTGTASLLFVNTTAGTTKVKAYLTSSLQISNEVESNFNEINPDLTTTLEATSNNAVANGKSYNQIVAIVKNKNTNNPVSLASVKFSILDGNATFLDSAKNFTTLTDGDGQAFARLISKVAGTSTVMAETYSGASNSLFVDFKEDYSDSELEIIRVYNNLKSFKESGPTTAWPNATIYLEASGGSGDYTWSSSHPSELLFENKSDDNAIFTFTSEARSGEEYIITVEDITAEMETTFAFTLDVFFISFGDFQKYNFLHSYLYPTLGDLTTLYNEWGDMDKYSEWLVDGINHYWSDTHDGIYPLASVGAVNLRNGKIDYLSGTFFRCGEARKR